jgi:hypothetical protein
MPEFLRFVTKPPRNGEILHFVDHIILHYKTWYLDRIREKIPDSMVANIQHLIRYTYFMQKKVLITFLFEKF